MQGDAVAVVLAGGGSRRLAPLGLGPAGKAAVVVEGEACLARVCRVVGEVVPRVIVVAAAAQPLPPLGPGVEIVRDAVPGGGPLAGLRDGLRHALTHGPRPRLAVVASCDVPLLAAAVVRRLLEHARRPGVRFVVPVVAGHPQVLLSVLDVDLLAGIEAAAAAGGGPRGVLERLAADEPAAVRRVDEAEIASIAGGLDSFLDLDTPEDLLRIESRGIPPSPA